MERHERARAAYDAATALAPSIADHLRIPGSQPFAPGVSEAFAFLERALADDEASGAAHAARGNILLRGGFLDHARTAYERAAALDARDAPSRYALGEIAMLAHDEAGARRWFDAAFARERLYSPPSPIPGARDALVLGRAGAWPDNIPLDFLIDERRWTLHRWFLPDPSAATRQLPRCDLIVNALSVSQTGAEALAAAEAISAWSTLPYVNAVSCIRALARDRLATTLGDIPGVVVAHAVRCEHDVLVALPAAAREVAGLCAPFVIRPVDAHGGREFERAQDVNELRAYAARMRRPAYDVGTFIDYRSPDGWYRKYRIMFAGGRPYPYHLAIDRERMIHYYRTATAQTPWMQAEERAFLLTPGAVVSGWERVLPTVIQALGLDYAGIDCAQLHDGTLVVFEADTAMLVHAFDTSEEGRQKRAATAAIGTALMTLLDERAAAGRRNLSDSKSDS